MDLIGVRKLQAYRIADQFLRLKRSEVIQLKNTGDVVSENVKHEYSAIERVKDFFYFNDFYVVAFLVILALVYTIFYVS